MAEVAEKEAQLKSEMENKDAEIQRLLQKISEMEK